MALLSQMCNLPDGWVAPTVTNEVGMSMKLAWKTAKRADHDRMLAYREREHRRAMRGGSAGLSMDRDRQRVYRETMAEPILMESRGRMFREGQGVRSPKKAKNRASKEQAGTIGRTIVTKRFDGSRLTCVCKSIVY